MELIIPTRVTFSSKTFIVEKDRAEGLPITLTLDHPLEKAGTVTIHIDESSSADGTQYTTSPEATSGDIVLNLDKGADTASFTITSAHNFDGNPTVVFKIIATTGGAILGDLNSRTATVTMRGNDWFIPEITASVTTLDDFGSVNKGAQSASKFYTISGTHLRGPVAVTASDNFLVSLNDTQYSKTLTIPTDVLSAPAKVYVKFAPSTGQNQAITGSISNTTPDAQNVIISVSGTESGNVPYVPEVPLLNENFEYGNESNFLTRLSPDWVAYSAPGSIPVTYITQGLTFPLYGSSGIGGAVTIEHGDFSREDIARVFTPQTTGTVYVASLMKLSAAGTGDFFFSLRDNSGGFFNRLYAKDDGNGKLVFGVGKNSSAQYPTATYNYNTTYLVVIKYDFTAKASSLYIVDGVPTVTEPATPTVVSSTGTNPTTLNDVAIRQNTGVLSATIDGIRIATTWRGAVGL
ncbi:hypothetical protein FW774_14970 [Pedobacter sp. BS3]|uniref:hypothetical protein n=1 Tax=Pedobacter sp. BS3 TaxID=2567937 RepID=UPI0011EED2B7|nr:hypothetical protein [Pedobacter sp. BS3]TZF82789.1 hypothetical protein FW774_14970 [Pedobacter sp. BS3]